MYLNGSCGTGKKILKNFESFSFNLLMEEQSKDNSVKYHFSWQFDSQFGELTIIVKNQKISTLSTIWRDSSLVDSFKRPLSMYNDPSLEPVFSKMLIKYGINI